MPKVICTRPNADLDMDGLEWTKHPDGRGIVSPDLSDAAATRYATFKGFSIVGAKPEKAASKAAAAAAAPAVPAKPKDTEADERMKHRAWLDGKARDLGIDPISGWSNSHLEHMISEEEHRLSAAAITAAAAAAAGGPSGDAPAQSEGSGSATVAAAAGSDPLVIPSLGSGGLPPEVF